MKPSISLIVSTYRNADYLGRVLESVRRQSLQPDEVLVTEDGASSEIAALIQGTRAHFGSRLHHLTQGDRGNRKPLAQNRAIAAARGDQLVFVDGDCVLRGDFVQAHADFAEAGCFLTGRRVELSQKASRWLSAERVASGALDGWPWPLLWDAAFGESRTLGRFFRTPGPLRALLGQDSVHDIRGCNFSVARADMLRINGFSNDFSGAYGEDSDVEMRLRFAGLRMKSVKGAAIQFHLWHAEQEKDAANQERLQRLAQRGEARAADGLAELSRHR